MENTRRMTKSCTLALMVISCLMIGVNANYGRIAQNIDNHAEDFSKTECKKLFNIHPHDGEHANETANGYTDGEITQGIILDKAESKHAEFLE